MSRFLHPKIFTENLPTKAKSATTTIISHLEAGRLRKAVSILFSTPFPLPAPLYSSIFNQCSNNRAIIEARKLESHLNTYFNPPPTFLINRAIECYAKCGCLRDAHELFDEMPQRNGGSWNVLISGYARGEKGLKGKALGLFLEMCRGGWGPSEVTFASVLGCCGDLLELGFSRGVHGFVVKVGLIGNVILGSALVDVYGKCGDICDARRMFDEIECKNDVSWNVIVRRYLEVGNEFQAIFMFFEAIREGVKPLSFTFSNALVACCGRHAYLEGVQIHALAIKCGFGDDENVATSFINMYMKCNDVVSARKIFDLLTYKDLLSWTSIVSGYAMTGGFEEAEELFNEMPERSNVSWNAMLAGYVHFGRWDEALNFIFVMCLEINDLDVVTLKLMLNVSAALLDIEIGKQVHAYIYRHGFESDIPVSNALVDMYEKCAAIRTAIKQYNNNITPMLSGPRLSDAWGVRAFKYEEGTKRVIFRFQSMIPAKVLRS